MKNSIYNFKIKIDWSLINSISNIDRLDSEWSSIERREGQSYKQLKTIATIRIV